MPGGPVTEQKKTEKAAGSKGKKADTDDSSGDDGTYIVGEDNKPAEADRELHKDPRDHTSAHERTGAQSGIQADEQQAGKQYARQGGAPGAYAPKGTAAPAGAASGALAKDGKALTLRFVLPSGQGSESLRAVADRIAQMLQRIGIRTDITKVSDASYFKDHIASGQYDLALYSWPGVRLPGHRRPPDLRQARPGGRRVAERGAELHAGRHRPGRPAVRPGARPRWTRARSARWSARPTPASGPRPVPSPSTSAPS